MKTSGNGKWYNRVFCLCLISIVLLYGCGRESNSAETYTPDSDSAEMTEKDGSAGDENMNVKDSNDYTLQTKVTEVMKDPVFEDYGRLIFPADVNISDGLRLQDVEDILMWYSNVNSEKTVEITNYLKDQAEAGGQIFYDIYTDEEKAEDPAKENTGLFFFCGNPGEKFAVVNC